MKNEADIKKLVHDLKVHQIELEMQNDELRKAHETIETSRQKYFDLFDLAPVAFIHFNSKGDIIDLNLAAARLFDQNKETFINTSFYKNIVKNDKDTFYLHLTNVFKTESRQSCELILLKKDGTEFWASFESVIVFDEKREFNTCTTAVHNISDRKQAEKALFESETKYRTIADFTYDWEYWVSPDEKIIYSSPSCKRITGYSANEFIQNDKLLTGIVHPNDADLFKNHKHKVLESGEIEPIEFRIVTKNNEERWIGHVCQAVYNNDGRNIGSRASNRDITEKKKNENLIRESEAKFYTTFNTNPDGMVIIRLSDGVYIDINKGFTNITGYTREEFIGKSHKEINIWENPNDRQKLIEGLKKDGKVNDLEARFLRKDGVILTGLFSVSIILLNNVQHTLSVSRDITQQKLEKEALRASENLLNISQQLTKVGGWNYNIKTGKNVWTKETYRIHEIDPTETGHDKSDFIERGIKCYDEKDRPIIMAAFNKCVKKGIAYDLEFPFTSVKGKRMWVRTSARAEKENNKIVNVTGSIVDISEQKTMQKAMAEKTELLKTTLDNFPNSYVSVINKNWTIGLSGGQEFKKLNIDPQSFFGMSVKDIYGEFGSETLETIIDAYSKTFKGQAQTFELILGDQYHYYKTTPLKQGKNEIEQILVVVENITSQKKADLQIRETSANLKSLIENRDDSIWSIDKNFNFIIFNSFFAKAYLAAYNIELKKGINVIDILTPELLKFWKPKYEAVFAGENVVFQFSENFGGSDHFYQVSLNPIVEGDNITGVSAISIEITDRVLAENKIFESEEKFRTLVGNLQGAAYRCNYDKSWTMQFLSGQIEKLTGYPANEFIKNRVRAYASIIHPGDRKMVESKVNAAIAKKEHFSIEHRIINANGNILWVIENGQGVFDEKNKVICIDGVLFDITERKKAENALHENEKKMRSLLNNLNAGIVVHAPNTSITFSHPRASELLGLSVEQMLGKKAIDPDWNFLDEKSNPLPPGEYPVNKIISAKKPIKNMSAGVVHSKTDDISWLLVNGFPVLNENGEITEIIINFIDITEVKIAEGELNKYREHLEELIKKRTQQLENKNAKLLRINKAFVGRELRMAELKKEIEKLKGNREVG